MAAEFYIGIMSGTSLDGVDAALCRFHPSDREPELSPSLDLISEASLPWPESVRKLLYHLATEETASIDDLARVHFLLAEYYALVVSEAVAKAGLTHSDIRAIGLHGQTIRHLPKPRAVGNGLPAVAATLQLGSGPALAARTRIDVVSDFRSADIALGGQGAPLVPMFDNAFLRTSLIDRVALNIGGIANITWLPSDAAKPIVAFDTGPGNMIVDSLARELFDRPFDASGEIAREGAANQLLLTELLTHEYFVEPPPKSTGRELFGNEFVSRVLREVRSNSLSPHDALATATELTARSVADAVSTLTNDNVEVLVSGGGAKNTFLLERLHHHLRNASVQSTETVGIPAQSKEAIAFAYFAFAFVNELDIHLPPTTGASRRVLLGSLSRGT